MSSALRILITKTKYPEAQTNPSNFVVVLGRIKGGECCLHCRPCYMQHEPRSMLDKTRVGNHFDVEHISRMMSWQFINLRVEPK